MPKIEVIARLNHQKRDQKILIVVPTKGSAGRIAADLTGLCPEGLSLKAELMKLGLSAQKREAMDAKAEWDKAATWLLKASLDREGDPKSEVLQTAFETALSDFRFADKALDEQS